MQVYQKSLHSAIREQIHPYPGFGCILPKRVNPLQTRAQRSFLCIAKCADFSKWRPGREPRVASRSGVPTADYLGCAILTTKEHKERLSGLYRNTKAKEAEIESHKRLLLFLRAARENQKDFVFLSFQRNGLCVPLCSFSRGFSSCGFAGVVALHSLLETNNPRMHGARVGGAMRTSRPTATDMRNCAWFRMRVGSPEWRSAAGHAKICTVTGDHTMDCFPPIADLSGEFFLSYAIRP